MAAASRSGLARDFDARQLVAAMVGRDIDTLFPRSPRTPGAIVLSAAHVSVDDPHVAGRQVVCDVSLEVRAGEIVGIAGLIGAGRSEFLMALFGAATGRVAGSCRHRRRATDAHTPRVAIDRGMALLGEDRKQLGLLLGSSVADNVVLPRIVAAGGTRRPLAGARPQRADNAIRTLGVRPADPDERASALSGGNQQKVLLGRWLETGPRVLLLDEPTRGIDIGAREEIYALIDRLAAAAWRSWSCRPIFQRCSASPIACWSCVWAGWSQSSLTTRRTPEAVMAAATGTVLGFGYWQPAQAFSRQP